MKRIWNWVFAGLSFLSLLLLIVFALLWIRSHFSSDNVERRSTQMTPLKRERGAINLGIAKGVLYISKEKQIWSSGFAGDAIIPSLNGASWNLLSFAKATNPSMSLSGKPLNFWMRAGFGFDRSTANYKNSTDTTWLVVLPFWFLMLLFACLPAARLLMRFRSRRQAGKQLTEPDQTA
jgi:hypothetical protein